MNMSNMGKVGQSVAKILRFFNFSKWRATPSWIFKFVKFHWQTVSGRPRLIIVLNVAKIGRLVVETLHFFEFLKWPTLPSWIFEITKFYWLLGSRGSRHISMPNFVKMAAAALLDCQIHKMLLADNSRSAQTRHFTKFCQNRSFLCGDVAIFRIFKMAAAAILDF